MNGVSVCAGIGGLDIGVELALGRPFDACLYVERELGAAAILAARMEAGQLAPGPIWDDLETACRIPGLEAFPVDVVTAGIPCQPFSVAGKGEGLDDDRWLGESLLDLVGKVGPSLVVVENVPGFATAGAARIAGGLSELGFDAEWGLFSAAAVGAPHKRQRFFMVAWRVPDAMRVSAHGKRAARECESRCVSAELGDVGEELADASGGWFSDSLRERSAQEYPQSSAGRRDMGEEFADADGAGLRVGGEPESPVLDPCCAQMVNANGGRFQGERQQERTGLEGARGTQSYRRRHYRGQPWPPAPNDTEGWQRWIEAGGPAPAIEPGVRRNADGLSGRVDRLRALGNAVVPQQAAYAIRALLERAGVAQVSSMTEVAT